MTNQTQAVELVRYMQAAWSKNWSDDMAIVWAAEFAPLDPAVCASTLRRLAHSEDWLPSIRKFYWEYDREHIRQHGRPELETPRPSREDRPPPDMKRVREILEPARQAIRESRVGRCVV